MLRALLFDLDNTLIDRDQAFRGLVCRNFHDPGVQKELLYLDNGGHGNREALFNAWRRNGGTIINHDVLGCAIAEGIRPDPCLLQALDVLGRTLKLGIISNGGSTGQRRKWTNGGFAEVIPYERVLVSAEVGVAKPDQRIFVVASQILDEAPENCLFIGDHEQNDFQGATAAGMRACLIDAVLSAERLHAIVKEEQRR